MARESLTTRSELPWIIGPLAALLIGWYIYNASIAGFYGDDLSEGGTYHLVSYGSDTNPARIEQTAIFDRYHEQEKLKVKLVPGGSKDRNVTTTVAAGNAPDILDVYQYGFLRQWAEKGMIVPINDYLKKLRDDKKIDIREVTWPGILDELRVPNPGWQEGQDELDQWDWYGVPNNMNIRMVWFNRSLYEKVRGDLGDEMPNEPWLHWTWWDYIKLGKVLQRRGEAGNILSFGCNPPDLQVTYLQIGMSMRGDDRQAFEALTADQRAKLGVGDLSWDECVSCFSPQDDGTFAFYPNRTALQQAFQLQHDIRHVIGAAPTATDQAQVSQLGGFGGGGGYGQFKSGTLAMFQEGRWFLGQVRNDTRFDWRLLRVPRWVPYDVWSDWEARGLAPEQRDGPWGEADGGNPYRGYGNLIGSRKSVISKTAAEHGRVDEAFAFLEFLLTNQDFNHVLLIEDGMGANRQAAYDYLSKPDPLFPGEEVRRPPAHEMGALERTVPAETWPYNNFWLTGFTRLNRDVGGTWLNKPIELEESEPLPYSYAALGADVTGNALVGRQLMERYVSQCEQLQRVGIAESTTDYRHLPNVVVILFALGFTAFFGVFGWWSYKTRGEDA